jgi:hypothetical protein
MRYALALTLVVGCGATPPPPSAVEEEDAGIDAGEEADAGTAADAGVDLDLDGLDDAFEAKVAEAYLPYLSVYPGDGCPRGGIVYRVRKHPKDPGLLLVLYDHLFERDCGLTGHDGDNEAFSITVNPAKAPPLGITAVKAISHQNTPCQRVTTCGRCAGLAACDGPTPRVYSSKDKHGTYATLSSCNPWTTCADSCTAAPTPNTPPMVNAGEPNAHLVENLTTQGFVTSAIGWSVQSEFNYNPWDPNTEFGKAGVVASDLVDPAFDTQACQ